VRLFLIALLSVSIVTSSHIVFALSIEDAIKVMAIEIQKTVPQRLSDNVTLSQASYINNILMLTYTVRGEKHILSPYLEKIKSQSILEKSSSLCSVRDSRWVLDNGGIYSFQFISSNAEFLFAFDISKINC